MNSDAAFRWDDGLTGPARNIAGLDHTPIRVLAGTGTGKTFALMRRVARLLQEGTIADQMLVCTFTRTMGAEIRGRNPWHCPTSASRFLDELGPGRPAPLVRSDIVGGVAV